jgi:hypothetical protein
MGEAHLKSRSRATILVNARRRNHDEDIPAIPVKSAIKAKNEFIETGIGALAPPSMIIVEAPIHSAR